MLRTGIGFALLVGSFIAAWMLENGNAATLLAPSAFIITFCVALFGVLSVWSFKDVRKAFSDAVSRNAADEDAKRSAAVWRLWERLSFIAGALGFIAGLALILSFPYAPDHSAGMAGFGRAIGASLMAPVYGIFQGIFGMIMISRLEKEPAKPVRI